MYADERLESPFARVERGLGALQQLLSHPLPPLFLFYFPIFSISANLLFSDVCNIGRTAKKKKEEPLPWGISQPKADFRRSGEGRRIFACQPNDVGSDRKVGGESLRRSEYFIILKWVAIGIRAQSDNSFKSIHEVQFSLWLANFAGRKQRGGNMTSRCFRLGHLQTCDPCVAVSAEQGSVSVVFLIFVGSNIRKSVQ